MYIFNTYIRVIIKNKLKYTTLTRYRCFTAHLAINNNGCRKRTLRDSKYFKYCSNILYAYLIRKYY